VADKGGSELEDEIHSSSADASFCSSVR